MPIGHFLGLAAPSGGQRLLFLAWPHDGDDVPGSALLALVLLAGKPPKLCSAIHWF